MFIDYEQYMYISFTLLLLSLSLNPSLFMYLSIYIFLMSIIFQIIFSLRNANMECRTKKGCTPFYLTCKEGYQGIAVMLVKHGANTEVRSLVI